MFRFSQDSSADQMVIRNRMFYMWRLSLLYSLFTSWRRCKQGGRHQQSLAESAVMAVMSASVVMALGSDDEVVMVLGSLSGV